MQTYSKPQRPFGVSIAIITGIFMFAIAPLLMAMFFAYLNNRVHLEGDGSFSGVSILGLSNPTIALYTGAAVVFLGVAWLAWRGRPAVMRFVFPGAVVVMALLMSSLIAIASSNSGFSDGIDSAENARQIFRGSYLVVILLVVLYVVWFFNRWSARAYYRGYYTQQDIALIESYQQEVKTAQQTSHAT